MKVQIGIAFGILLCSLLAAGCGDDEDPITSACSKSCALEKSHPCASQQDQCVADCKAIASTVQNQYSTDCAICVAKTAEYSVKTDCGDSPDCCWGHLPFQPPTELPDCLVHCFEPDAGVAY